MARALRELGYNTSHVGNVEDGAPPRGAPDDEVLSHAKATHQVVVTSNHDMILLCCEQSEAVIWVDPVGRHFKVDEFALVAFRGIAQWESLLLAAREPTCIRVLRTKVEEVTLDRAADMVWKRIRRVQAKKRQKKPRPLGPFLADQ